MPQVGTIMARGVHLKSEMVLYLIASGRYLSRLDCLYQHGKLVCLYGISKSETLQKYPQAVQDLQ